MYRTHFSAFLFPGRRTQYVGMGRRLLSRYDVARATYAEADAALQLPLTQVMREGPAELLEKNEYAQPAILTYTVACYRVLAQQGRTATLFAGHSVGEYAALVAGGALDFSTAVRLVHLRGKFMDEAVQEGAGRTAVISGIEAAQVEQLCAETKQAGEVLDVAAYNHPKQTVISGHARAVERATARAEQRGGKATLLDVSGAIHSALMQPAAMRLARELEQVELRDPDPAYVSSVTASAVVKADAIRQLLVEQLTGPVRWHDTTLKLMALGVESFLEVGPGCTLSRLLKRIGPRIDVVAVDDQEHRRHTRVETSVPYRCVGEHLSFSGKVKDLSLSGAFLTTSEDRVAVGDTIELILPDEHGEDALHVPATVVREAPTGYGVRFRAPSKELLEKIGFLLEHTLSASGLGKRHHPRVHRRVQVRLSGKHTTGLLADLSVGGIGLELAPGEAVEGNGTFIVQLPVHDDEVLNLPVRTRWVRRTPDGGFHVGAEFVDMKQDQRLAVQRYLRSLALES